jgi:hypothetical protein
MERVYLTGGKGFFDGYIVRGSSNMWQGISAVDNIKIKFFLIESKAF